MKLTGEDAVEVAALVAKYNRAFDGDDMDSWIETFTPDGIFVSKGSAVKGHDEMRSWFVEQIHNTIHVTTDPTLDERDGIFHHRCTVLVFRRFDEGTVLSAVGEYSDILTKTSEGWRFSQRAPVISPVISK